jgi:hypothetical protein
MSNLSRKNSFIIPTSDQSYPTFQDKTVNKILYENT